MLHSASKRAFCSLVTPRILLLESKENHRGRSHLLCLQVLHKYYRRTDTSCYTKTLQLPGKLPRREIHGARTSAGGTPPAPHGAPPQTTPLRSPLPRDGADGRPRGHPPPASRSVRGRTFPRGGGALRRGSAAAPPPFLGCWRGAERQPQPRGGCAQPLAGGLPPHRRPPRPVPLPAPPPPPSRPTAGRSPARPSDPRRPEGGCAPGDPRRPDPRKLPALTLMMLLLRGVALAASSRQASGSGAAAVPRLPPGKRSAAPTAETPLRRSRLLPAAAAGASSEAGSGSSSARWAASGGARPAAVLPAASAIAPASGGNFSGALRGRGGRARAGGRTDGVPRRSPHGTAAAAPTFPGGAIPRPPQLRVPARNSAAPAATEERGGWRGSAPRGRRKVAGRGGGAGRPAGLPRGAPCGRRAQEVPPRHRSVVTGAGRVLTGGVDGRGDGPLSTVAATRGRRGGQ